MKVFKTFVVLFVAACTITSCENEKIDTEGPEVQILNIEEDQEFYFGEELVMHLLFKDQVGMDAYRYEIFAKDYTERSFMYRNTIELRSYYTQLEEFRSVLLPKKTTIEDYQEGEYLIKITASDIRGNLSEHFKTINIFYPETAD